MIRAFLAAALIALSTMAYGQSSPNWTYGYVPTPGQWNQVFASKQDTLGYTPLNRAGDSMQGPLGIAASTTSNAGLNFNQGVAPTTPSNGDVWFTSSGLFYDNNGVTVGPIGASAAGGDLTGNYPNPTVAKVNGTSYPATPSTNTVPVVTGSNVVTYEQVPNAAIANPATTVNGVTCTLGSTCTISASAGNITIGTTGIVGGTSGNALYDNAGVLGERQVTGSGNVVLATSPSITTPTFAAGGATFNGSTSGSTVLQPSATASGTLTLPAATDQLVGRATTDTMTNKSMSGSANTFTNIPNSALVNTATTVNGQTCTLGASCSITATAGTITVGTTSIASGTSGNIEFNNAGVLGEKSVTGSGSVVLATSPTLITPTLGAATATTVNKVTITQPATGSTLTIADGKTLTANNSLTLSGTDGKSLALTNGLTISGNDGTLSFGGVSKTLTVNNSLALTGTDATVMTFPSTSATIARTDAGQTFTGVQTFSTPIAVGSGGTGLGSGTQGGFPWYSGSTTLASTGVMAANQLIVGGGTGAAPSTLGALGTTTTLLHGNPSGLPTFSSVVSGDLNITGTSCTNQFITAISSAAAGTCTTNVLAGAQHANQGTTTTVLHGNASGNPSWGQVGLTTDVTGTLPLGNGGTGQTTASAARASSGLNIDQISTNGDSNYSIPAATRTAATSATLTAVRTWTLPAANAVNGGQHLLVADLAGGINGANTITVAAAGTDTINGAASFSITSQYGQAELVSDGVSKWTYAASSGGGGSGTVTSITAGTGLAGGTITTSGTISLATPVAASNGGTGLSTFTAANNAIYSSSSSALTAGTLPVAAGGTGSTSLTAHSVLTGNGTSAPNTVAPSTSGNALVSNGTDWISAAPTTLGTVHTPTSGTTDDYTGLPPGIKELKLIVAGVKMNANYTLAFQIGDATGGLKASGYNAAGGYITTSVGIVAATNGFGLSANTSAQAVSGVGTFTLLNASTNLWTFTFVGMIDSSTIMVTGAGSVTLSGALDRIRTTSTTGTPTFTAGSINIAYTY